MGTLMYPSLIGPIKNGLLLLLMITLAYVGYICWLIKLRFDQSSWTFTLWYKLGFTSKFKFFVLIMVLSISITSWALTYKKMVLSVKVLALTPLTKMGLQNGKINILLQLLVPCCLTLTCPHNFRVTPFCQPHTLLTECLVESYLLSHPSRNSKSFFPILDSMHIFHFVSLGPLCLSTFTHLSGTNWIPALKCVFLGYSSIQKGYKCYDPISQKLYVSLDVTFFEHTPYYSLQGSLWVKLDHP